MSERGFALVTVVLLMLGLAVLATALGFSAAQQVGVRASLHDLARARAAADAGARAIVDEWDAARRSIEPVGQRIVLRLVDFDSGVRVFASSTRLSGSTWLVDAEATVTRGALPPVTHRARRIVRGLDADSVGAAFDAALIAGRVRVGGGAVVTGEPAAGSGDEDLCLDWPANGAALRAPPESTTVSAEASVVGTPVLVADPDPARFRNGLGVLDGPRLIDAAVPIAGDHASPAPVERNGTCDVGTPTNWGAASGPCATHHVLAHAVGDLIIQGGYGQGVLLASGDLVLDGGFEFHGLILAAGSVFVRDARIHGSIAAAAIDAGSGGGVTLDRCAIAAALARIRPLGRALIPPRSWLPTFD